MKNKKSAWKKLGVIVSFAQKRYGSQIWRVVTYLNFQNKNNRFTIVRGELFEEIFPIEDMNADALLIVGISDGNQNAKFNLIQPKIIQVPIETPDSIDLQLKIEIIDTTAVQPKTDADSLITEVSKPEPADTIHEPVFVDTVQTEFEGFIEYIL